jgi:transcriptional regulator with XRE-family HTH domain
MTTNPMVRVDAQKLRRLRDDLGRRLGYDVTQEYVSEKSGVTRALISYMENPKSKRRFSFETVYLIARFYREALRDPTITCEFVAIELDRLRPRPLVDENPETSHAREQKIRTLYDKLTDMPPEQLAKVDEYLDFILVQRDQ